MLNVVEEHLGETVVLCCQGDLVREQESSLLCAALGNYGRDILLDLSEVEAIDAAGSGALLALQAAGVYLRLHNPTTVVREFLRAKTMDPLFEISEGDAHSLTYVENNPLLPCRAA
jgi:anti-anti-sigma regulatory factor